MTSAQRRFLADVLAWGGERPPVPGGLVRDLREHLERGLGEHRSARVGRAPAVIVTEARLERHVCDGWQRDPAPFVHDRANVRGALASRVVATDVVRGRDLPSTAVVDHVWQEVASSDPGNPASRSAWLNRCPPTVAADLREELADLLVTFREVWPPLPSTLVEQVPGRRHEVVLADGAVRLRAVPDLVLDSPLDDGRARTVVVSFRTGLPRGGLDRERLRFQALVVALARGRPPFRWVSYYVSEGRAEVEDLDAEPLRHAAEHVLAAVDQLLAPTETAPGGQGRPPAEHLEPGPWCRFCARLGVCEVAAQSPASLLAR